MAFFANGAVNRVNIHYGVQALAQAAGGLFMLVFLLRAGLPVPVAFLVLAAMLAGRFILRPAILPVAKRCGLKTTLIIGALVLAVQYPLIAEVHGVGPMLLALIVVASLGDVFYWTSFHAYFAVLGDAEHRGHQIGAREALAEVVGILGPLLGAAALTALGPRVTFGAVGVIQALSALPLIGAPNVAVARTAPGSFVRARVGLALFATDGWFAGCFFYVWQVALFISLKGSLSAYGGAMALAALVGAVAGMLLGRHIDAGHGRRSVLIAYGLAALVVVVRAASLGSPWLAVAANAPGVLVTALVVPALLTPVYNLAQASPCPLRFNIVAEGGWDLGCFAAALTAAACTASGLSLAAPLLAALPGALVAVLLLFRQYRGPSRADGPCPDKAVG
jgi:DHA1 family inner membrane transport protein